MSQKKTTSKQTQLLAVAIIAAVAIVATGTMIFVTNNNDKNLQQATAQTYPSGTDTKKYSSSNLPLMDHHTTTIGASLGATTKSVNPSQTTDKEFWINTVHLDGNTNIHPGVKCDTCPQNTPLHPAEQPPVNSTIPTGGGFRVTEPNKVGAWDFRSFTFSPDQIVVNQGDKVTLHFVGVQGAHHVIEIQGIDSFELMRGQIHTVSFIANSPGIITYICHVHLPNMVGQILVLPKSAV